MELLLLFKFGARISKTDLFIMSIVQYIYHLTFKRSICVIEVGIR